jgi:tetratricopeptide (TPR) repeat protein
MVLVVGLLFSNDAAPAAAQSVVSCRAADDRATIVSCTRAIDARLADEEQLAVHLAERGYALSNLKDYAAAVKDLTSAIEVAPAYASAYRLRAWCYLMLAEFDRSIADYDQAQALDPSSRDIYAFRAMAWTAKNDAFRTLADIAAAIDQARKVVGESADDLQFNSLVHIWRHDYERAIPALDRALDRDPDHRESLIARGDACIRLGRHACAIADLSKAIALQPDEPTAYLSRGEAHLRAGDTSAATRDLERAFALVPDPRDAWDFNTRAWALALLGRFQQALPDAEQALRLLPNDPATLHTRGRIKEGLARRDEAIADYKLALRFDPGHPECLEELRRLGELPAKK